MTRRGFGLLAFTVLLVTGFSPPLSSEPLYNFDAMNIEIAPGEDGSTELQLHFGIQIADSVPDVPFVYELHHNGMPIVRDSSNIIAAGPLFDCLLGGDPCSTHTCPDITFIITVGGNCFDAGIVCQCDYIGIFSSLVQPEPGANEYTFILDPDNLVEEWNEDDNSVSVTLATPIPTLTEWGLIIFTLLLLAWMVRVAMRRRRRAQVAA